MGDVYPYTASSTTVRTLFPDWMLEKGIDAMLERLQDPAVRARIRREMAGTGDSLVRIRYVGLTTSSASQYRPMMARRCGATRST